MRGDCASKCSAALLAALLGCALAIQVGCKPAPAAPRQSAWQRDFWAAIREADEAKQNENWRRAERALGAALALSPYDPTLHVERAAALMRLNRSKDAASELRAAVEGGWDDADALRQNSSFAALADDAEFRVILDACASCAAEEVAVYVPPQLDRRAAAPLLIAFHGRGENPRRHLASWREPANQLGLVVVAPRGPRRFGRSAAAYEWRASRDSAESSDVGTESLALARKRAAECATIDESRLILAGYSQGGAVALALLAADPARFRGAVVQATAFGPRAAPAAGVTIHGAPRIMIFAHELDRMAPESRAAFDAWSAAGADAQLELVAGSDHELPPDNSARRIRALRYVLEPGR